MSIGSAAPRPVAWCAAILAVVLATPLYGGPGKVAGQQQQVEQPRRTVEFSPRVGPPGTQVTLRSRQMPALTPVQLAIGATRSGFEGLALRQTDAEGVLEETVEVPGWAKSDQIHRFIVFNLYFSNVLAESGIFHVTDEEGVVVRQGEVASAGVRCMALRGDDGERYRLVGAVEGLRVGERRIVEGILSESESGCGDDLSLELEIRSERTPRP